MSAIDLTVPPLEELCRRRSEKWALFDSDVLSLTVAEMDFPILAEVGRVLAATIERGDLGYGVPAPRGLREALAGFAERRLSWRLDPEQVTIVPDVMLGIVELCRTIAGPGGAVGFATPAYPPFFREPALAGLDTVPIGLAPDGSIDPGQLDAALRSGLRVLVLSNPHNPTGRVLPQTELAAIAERCAEFEVWVLADEIHAPLVLPGATHVPWLEVSDAARRWGIVLTSASKAFNLAALKTAFLVTADPVARSVVQRIGPQHDHASLLGELAAEVAFREGDQWLDVVVDQLARNREQLCVELRQRLPDVRWQPPQGTYLAWLDCRGLDLEDEPADVFLQRGRVALGPGLDYGEPGARHARLNFATGPEHLTEAVARMAAALRR
ncbi:MAG TPA: aminotransferase class I/II-fold pyridoxal phosphate-dependent enzyme [Solirubrobacteraceae bacterium]|jgi:cystathionine beta-lyase